MKSIIYVTLSTFLLLTSCGNKETKTKDITLINGGKTYGGELVFSSSEVVSETFPIASANVNVINISSQIYETLLNIDPTTLEVVPGIASEFSSNDEGNVYTFKIRKGIFFHDDECFGGKGRELTPEDVKFSLDFVCSGNPLNQDDDILVNRIKGAKEFKSKSATSFPKGGVSGIKVKGDAVEITLNKPFIGFEELLTRKNTIIFPKEAFEKYGNDIKTHPVGTGAFKLESIDKSQIRLVRNDNYWQKDEFGNQLPYLSAVVLKFIPNKKDEMLAFRNKNIDLLLDIPAAEIENVLGTLQDAMAGKNVKHKVESSQSLNIEYVGFNTADGVFASKEVREAFLYAVNPSELIEKYIGGDGYPATNGFVPEIEGANNQTPAAPANPEKARKLLAQAGYANGANFPATTIYVNGVEGSRSEALIKGYCEVIKRELNIDLSIKLCSLTEREAAIKNGEAKIWRAGWVADYPSPITFLELFYSSGNATNDFKYNNAEFNKTLELSQLEKDSRKKGFLFIKAQSLIAADAVVSPLVVNNMLFMVNARVKGLKANTLEQLNFKDAYIKPSVKEENE